MQDQYHYTTRWDSNLPLERIQRQDNINVISLWCFLWFQSALKKELITKRGDTLIQVPCWWDGKIDRYLAIHLINGNDCLYSLVATLKNIRPELVSNIEVNAGPIPDDPPKGFFPGTQEIPLQYWHLQISARSARSRRIDVGFLHWFFTIYGDQLVCLFNCIMLILPVIRLISEKYDGIRACWVPSHDKLYQLRAGNRE